MINARFNTILLASLLSAIAIANSAYAARGVIYKTNHDIIKGMVVGIDPSNRENVISYSNANSELVLGVVTGISDEGDNKEVEIATEGEVNTLVSTLNGGIKKGDAIGLSVAEGIAAKFGGQGIVIGIAAEDFDTAGSAVIDQRFTDTSSGVSEAHKIGILPVKIGIHKVASESQSSDSQSYIPSSVQNFSNGLAGKEVPTNRIVAAAAVVATGFIASMVIIRNAVNSSIVAIGRNPLVKQSTINTLMGIFLLAISILLTSMIAGFLIIKL